MEKHKTSSWAPTGANKRVLIVLEALDMSGPSFSALNLMTGLQQNGTKVMVMARAGGEREQSFQQPGTTVIIDWKLGRPVIGHALDRVIKEFEPAIIHAQSPAAAKYCTRYAKILDVPLVITVNRLSEEENATLLPMEDAYLVALSEAIRERLINRSGFERDRITVIPNGLNLDHFPKPDFDTRLLKPHTPVVGTYGTITEKKGQRTFVEAAAKVLKHGADAEFLIMGFGPDKPTLRHMAGELGVNNRLTFSPSTYSDLSRMHTIDIFVEPTYEEGFGLSVLQAMATGIPVIASGVGGIFSIIKDSETGILVPRADADTLADAILKLLNDPQKRTELARNARENVEKNYSCEKIARTILAHYAKILQEEQDESNNAGNE